MDGNAVASPGRRVRVDIGEDHPLAWITHDIACAWLVEEVS
jgi:hypothetical protein